MKKFVAFLLLVMMLFTVALAEEPAIQTSGAYQYIVLDDGTAKIMKSTSLAIPSEVDGHTVSGIGDNAFIDIGDPCDTIIIPECVTSVGINPFSGNNNVAIYVSPEHPTLESDKGVLYSKADKRVIACPRDYFRNLADGRKYDILNGTVSIGDFAFFNCLNITSITIPDSVTSIGTAAFACCMSLTSINIPDSVTSIGLLPFDTCYNLTVTVNPGSYAEQYCKDNNVPYKYAE